MRVARRLIARQEGHRRRVAAALHGEVGQMLAALRLNLVSPELTPETQGGRQLLEESRALVIEPIDHLRALTSELWPAILDDLGLEDAVDWYLQHVAATAGFRGELHTAGSTHGLDAAVARTGFDVVREALANTAAHGGAARVAVTLRRRRESLTLEVQDDGCGFEPAAVHGESGAGEGGLAYAAGRVELLRGELAVESAPGRGTLVRAMVPLEQR